MPLKVLIASFTLCVLPALAKEVGMKIVPLQPLVVYDSPQPASFPALTRLRRLRVKTMDWSHTTCNNWREMRGSKSVPCRLSILIASPLSARRMWRRVTPPNVGCSLIWARRAAIRAVGCYAVKRLPAWRVPRLASHAKTFSCARRAQDHGSDRFDCK